MLSPIVDATIQATIISFCSSIFAIFYSNSTPPIIPLLIFTILATPPNYLWQQYLERVFPGQTAQKRELDDGDKDAKVKYRLNVRNTLTKFALDQTVGALVNVALFLGGIRFLRGLPVDECLQGVREVCFIRDNP